MSSGHQTAGSPPTSHQDQISEINRGEKNERRPCNSSSLNIVTGNEEQPEKEGGPNYLTWENLLKFSKCDDKLQRKNDIPVRRSRNSKHTFVSQRTFCRPKSVSGCHWIQFLHILTPSLKFLNLRRSWRNFRQWRNSDSNLHRFRLFML